MSAELEIRTLGGLSICLSGKLITGFDSRKAPALLVYLACTRCSHPREELAEFLWEERSQTQALSNLRVALTSLRRTVGPFMSITRQSVGIHWDGDVWLDAAAFETRLNTAGTDVARLAEAVDLYSGDFLAGFYIDSTAFESWATRERERLRLVVMDGLDRLAVRHTELGSFQAGISAATRLLGLDPLREESHRLLIDLLWKSGQRAKALDQYTICRQVLIDELGIEPSAETTGLFERVRAGEQPSPQVRQAIRGYIIRDCIGVGGFGEVYRAWQPVVDREVAIKVIRPGYANQPDFIRRFETEAQLVAQLEHPHIVPLYDFWREPDGAFLVTRLLRQSLHARLKSGPLSLSDCARVVEQVAAALTVAHRAGVIHHDLKPANVLLDDDGNAYLSDFGIARVLGAAPHTVQEGTMTETPTYLSPEQIRGDPVGVQSDLYCFGVLVYECLAGQSPFPARLSALQLLDTLLSSPPPSLRDTRPELPAALDEVISHAMAVDPAQRYRDALELAAAFRQAVGADSWQGGSPDVHAWTPAHHLVVQRNPYKGLRAFSEADAGDFYGREALTDRLVARLSEDHPFARFLAVVGPSGSGKSSVAKAGLLPALRRGMLPGSDSWFIAEMLPGTHPLDELEIALLRVATQKPPSLVEQLERDERGLARAARLVLAENGELLLLIDQFEEVFMLVEEEAHARHFLDLIFAAVTDPHCPLRVVITLRADFYDRPLMIPDFCELVRQRTEVIVPLTRAELEHAVIGPAERAGITVEPALLAVVVSEVGERPSALPMLQYALTELYERRSDHTLSLDAYRALGGVMGVLAQRADEIYDSLDENRQSVAQQIFLRLVTLGDGAEDTRRRTRQSELLAIDGEAVTDVLKAFGQPRLLTFDYDPITREPTVEVAHEAIIREWRLLHLWLDESRDDIRQQRLLAAAAAEWKCSAQDRSYLLGGSRLSQFQGWAARTGITLTTDERQFLSTSVAEEQNRQIRRRRVRNTAFGTVIAVALIMTVLALVAFDREQQAQEERTKAESEATINRSLVLSGNAQQAFDSGESDLALALALEAVNGEQPPAEAVRTLSTVAFGMGTRALLRNQGNRVKAVAFSSDSNLGLSGSCAKLVEGVCTQGELIVWDIQSATELRRLGGHTDWVTSVAFDPTTPERALSTSEDGTLILWNVETGELIRRFEGHTGSVTSVAFSIDGRTALSGSDDHTAILWEVATGQIIRRFEGHNDGITAVAFSPDQHLAAAGGDSADPKILLWEVDTGEVVHSLVEPGSRALTINFRTNKQGQTLLFELSFDTVYREWNIDTGRLVRSASIANTPSGISISPDGRNELECEGNVCNWMDVTSWTPVNLILTPSRQLIRANAVSPDGRFALIGSDAGEVILVNLPVSPEIRRFHAEGGLSTVDISPDGRYLLTGGYDGGVAILWDAQTGQEVRRLDGLESQILSARFSPDGRQALICSSATFSGTAANKVVLWDIETGEVLHELMGHTFLPRASTFSPDGRTALTGTIQWGTAWEEEGVEGELILWDLTAGQEIRRFEPTGSILDISISPDGRKAVTANSVYDHVTLWDISTGQRIRQVDHIAAAVLFTADSRYFLTGSEGGFIFLVDAETGADVRFFTAPSARFWAFDISPDQKYVLAGGHQGLLVVWSFETGEELQRFWGRSYSTVLWNVVFSPDGQTAYSSTFGPQEDVIQWRITDWPLDDLFAWVRENRYVRDFTCEERAQYRIEPLCE
ncbi:nSTAND1 domain-containing NTPase [Aggregatilinea lenta]|uniref:nSTAND1 domain-containing NTPase n=1 Tax=Aggregatilinea lenta TaxID=913108 RepID=UPI000E5AA4D7|nr:protein kinase [Aggregatilinea lenta]